MSARQLLHVLLWTPLALLAACGGEHAGTSPAGLPASQAPPSEGAGAPKTVEAVRVAQAAGDGVVEVPSTLTVDHDVEVMSRLTGVLDEILVDRGQRVSRGQALARLDNRDLALKVEAQEKSYLLARAEHERARALSETHVISPQDYDTKRLEAEKAEAEWKLAQAELDKSFIKAPFGGVVSERYARLGQRVVEDDNTPLFRITSLEPLLARFYLPEARLGQLRAGDPVSVRISGDPPRECKGRIRWISPVVDAASGTFQALAEVDRPPGDTTLRPGLSITVSLPLGRGSAVVLVDRTALSEGEMATDDSPAHLFVVEDGRAVLRTIKLGKVLQEKAEILSGLQEGELVVRSFRQDLRDGERVSATLVH